MWSFQVKVKVPIRFLRPIAGGSSFMFPILGEFGTKFCCEEAKGL